MRKRIGLRGTLRVLTFSVLASSCNSQPAPVADRALPVGCVAGEHSTPEPERIRRVLAALRPVVMFSNAELPSMSVDDRMQRYNVPGLSIAVIDSGRVAWSCSFGTKREGTHDSVTSTTLFHVKSIAKPVTAVATMRLVSRGVLELDAPLVESSRSYRIPSNEHTQAVAPTLRHVQSHTAGFTRGGVDSYAKGQAVPSLIQSLEGQAPASDQAVTIDFTPGTRSRYSGGGFGVLQATLQDVTGRSFSQLMDSLVFQPLHMTHSFFPQPLPPALRPNAADGHTSDGDVIPGGHETLPIQAAGGLWTTATDLAAFVLAVQRSYSGQDSVFLPRDLAREMLRHHIDGWGLGFQVDQHSAVMFQHSGSGDGFKALMVGSVNAGLGAVVLGNSDAAGPIRYELLRSIAEEYKWPAFRDSSVYSLAQGVTSDQLNTVAGVYHWASGLRSNVEVRANHIFESFNGGAMERLFPLTPTHFVSLGDVHYRFRTGSDGRWTLELTDPSGTSVAKRVSN
jgi:CubicO group peptidase (beta-lactamase class C family)